MSQKLLQTSSQEPSDLLVPFYQLLKKNIITQTRQKKLPLKSSIKSSLHVPSTTDKLPVTAEHLCINKHDDVYATGCVTQRATKPLINDSLSIIHEHRKNTTKGKDRDEVINSDVMGSQSDSTQRNTQDHNQHSTEKSQNLTTPPYQYQNKLASYYNDYIPSSDIQADIKADVQKVRALIKGINSLKDLKVAIENFDGCELKKLANNTVFGEGSEVAKVMCIGEAPGATEDIEGKPFCGESGTLLDNMLASIGLSRKTNTYITNTVFWRPPANRTPTDYETNICKPFLEKYISLINPNLIILVGSTAASSLLNIKNSMHNMRNTKYFYTNEYLTRQVNVAVIFHPAYLLRQPFKKKDMWYDLLKIKENFL